MIEQEILRIIQESFPIKKDDITLDTPLETVIRDSMDFIELVAILSAKYKLSPDPKKLNKIITIRDIAKYILSKEPKNDLAPGKNLLGF
jgi:acyl carrier protein